MPDKKTFLSDAVYNILKTIAILFLPALGTLYFALAQIWHLPKAEEVVGSITAVDTFLGVLLGLSTMSYNNSGAKYAGVIDATTNPVDGSTAFLLNLHGDPEEVMNAGKDITFKINN